MDLPPVSRVDWPRTYRIIPSRYPPIDLFERLVEPDDLDVLLALESRTNRRLATLSGTLPRDQWLLGPGCSPIMAAFLHPGPSRFSDGRFGVYYTAESQETAIAETAYHRGLFMATTNEPAQDADMRVYIGSIDADLHDVRAGWRELHDPEDYLTSRRMADRLRDAGSTGLVYVSVRRHGGECVAAFTPRALAPCSPTQYLVQGPHLRYRWDGHRISGYCELDAHSHPKTLLCPIPA